MRRRFFHLCGAGRVLTLAVILVGAAFLVACGGGSAAATGDPQQGRQAVEKYNCGRCHTIPGVSGANGTAAPSLAGIAGRPQIAGTAQNTPDNLVKWIQNPQSVKPGTRMPTLGVTEAEAKNIAAYLGTLK